MHMHGTRRNGASGPFRDRVRNRTGRKNKRWPDGEPVRSVALGCPASRVRSSPQACRRNQPLWCREELRPWSSGRDDEGICKPASGRFYRRKPETFARAESYLNWSQIGSQRLHGMGRLIRYKFPFKSVTTILVAGQPRCGMSCKKDASIHITCESGG